MHIKHILLLGREVQETGVSALENTPDKKGEQMLVCYGKPNKEFDTGRIPNF